MKGPFGLLLIGGGIILIYGLFTGKISLGSSTLGLANNGTPFATGTTPATGLPGQQKQPKGCKGNPGKVIGVAPPIVLPDAQGCCPDGYAKVASGITGGQGLICVNQYNVNI